MDFIISYTTIWKLNINNPGKGRGSHHVFRHKLPLPGSLSKKKGGEMAKISK